MRVDWETRGNQFVVEPHWNLRQARAALEAERAEFQMSIVVRISNASQTHQEWNCIWFTREVRVRSA